MSESLSFDLIVRDDSERGLKKFADNLKKADKAGQAAGKSISGGLDKAGKSADDAGSKMDRLKDKFEALKTKAGETNEKGLSPLGLGLIALGPAAGPIVTAAIPAVIGLGAALAGAGAAGKLFGSVLTATLAEVQDDAKNLDTMQDKIAELGDTARLAGARGDKDAQKSALDAQKVAVQQYQDALKQMDPDQKKAVQNYRMMTNTWQQFIDKNKPATFGILAQGYDLIKLAIGEAQPLFDAAARAASGFLDRVGEWAKGGGLKSLVDFLAGQASKTFSTLEVILRNLVRGFAPLFKLASGQGQSLLHWVSTLSVKFAQFGQGGGWERFLAYTSENGPQLMSILTNLGTSLVTIAQAVTPLAPLSLALAAGLTAIIAAVPQGVLTGIVGLFVAYSAAMKIYAAYTLLAAAATKAQMIQQWALNSAILANPITWIVVGIVALIAVIVLVATKTRFFQTVWSKSFAVIKAVANGAWRLIKATALGLFAALKLYISGYLAVWKTIFRVVRYTAVAAFNGVRTVARAVAGAVSSAWRTAVGRIKALIQDIRTKAGAVMGQIRSLFSPSALYAAGQQLIIGLAKGIASKAAAPINAVKGILSNLKAHLPGSPIKKGPLKPWNKGAAGKKLMLLLAKGVKAGAGDVQKAISGVTKLQAKVAIAKAATRGKGAPGTTASKAVAGIRRVIGGKGGVASTVDRAVTKKLKSGTKSGSKSGGGSGGGGGGGGLTVVVSGTNLSTPEQVAKAVVSGLRQAKANGYVVPFGTFQGGSV